MFVLRHGGFLSGKYTQAVVEAVVHEEDFGITLEDESAFDDVDTTAVAEGLRRAYDAPVADAADATDNAGESHLKETLCVYSASV